MCISHYRVAECLRQYTRRCVVACACLSEAGILNHALLPSIAHSHSFLVIPLTPPPPFPPQTYLVVAEGSWLLWRNGASLNTTIKRGTKVTWLWGSDDPISITSE